MTDDPMAELERALYAMEGARIAAAHQLTQEGDFEEAYQFVGEATAYRRTRNVVRYYGEKGELPDLFDRERWKLYERLARVKSEADHVANADDDDELDDDPRLGVQ